MKKEYLEQFKSLCPHIEFNTNSIEFEQAVRYLRHKPRKDIWERTNFYKIEKEEFDNTELSNWLCIYWDKIMWQPFWYLENRFNFYVVDLKFDLIKWQPVWNLETINKKNQTTLSKKIEEHTGKLIRLKNQIYPSLILSLFEQNEKGTIRLLRGILLNYSRILDQICLSNIAALFNYKESPMFFGFYELIGKIQESYFEFGGVGRFDKIDDYIRLIPELKQRFEIIESNQEDEANWP